MKKEVLSLLSIATTCAFLLPAQAAPISAASKRMVPGDEAFKRVTKLTSEISWYTSLDYAEKMAQKENKPIFWLHMLGPLNGKT